MSCAGRHAVVLKQTDPVLNIYLVLQYIVLDFHQKIELLSSIFEKKLPRSPQRGRTSRCCSLIGHFRRLTTKETSYDARQRCPSALSGAALAVSSERGPSACQSRWTWDQAWLVSSWKCARDTLEMLVGWAIRGSQCGLDNVERH